MRLPSQVAALCLAAIATPLSARPFVADDLLNAEEFGQIGFSPDGGYLVFERLIGQAKAGPFDQDVATGYRRSRLFVVDLKRDGPALPLLSETPGEGQIAGPFSPDGRRMVVLRFAGDRYEAGVVTFATGAVRWLGVTPELGWLGQTVVWRDNNQLLIAARPEGSPPMRLRTGASHRQDLAALWSETARGETPAVRLVASGRVLAEAPPPAIGCLLLVDVRTGDLRRLAEGEFYDLELSPDGQKVAGMQRLEPIQAPADAPLYVAGDFQRRNLLVADLASGAVATPCATCHLATHLIAWSPDGREVLVYGQADGPFRGPSTYLRLTVGAPPKPVPLPGLTPVVDRTSEGYEIPRAGWLKGLPVVLARPIDGGRSDWWRIGPDGSNNLTSTLAAEPGPLAGRQNETLFTFAGGGVWRIGAEERPTRLSSANGQVPTSSLGLASRLKLNAPSGAAWFRTPATLKSAGLLRSSSRREIPLRPTTAKTLALVADTNGAAQVRRDPAGPLYLDLLRPNGRTRTLMRLNEPLLEVDFAHPLLLPAGETEKHVLLLPAHFPPGRRPALVVIPYPGLTYEAPPEPYGRGVGRYSVNAEILAGAGFAVLLPSLPRPRGGEPGAGLAHQLLAAVDQAAETGLVDADRLGIVGHSFGGYASLMAAAQSERFKAVIASGAPADLAVMYGSFDPHLETQVQDGINLNANFGWSELGQAGLGVPPWRDPDLYRRNSPYALVEHIAAPVLLIHGDGDFVRLQQAQQMFAGLYRQRKDAELVTYFGEGHIVSSPANLRDMYERMIQWLNRSLAEP